MSAISLVAAILEGEQQDRSGIKVPESVQEEGPRGPRLRGAARVRLSGATNADGSLSGINGDYVRTEEMANGKSVYAKVGKASTSMWYYNVDGRHQWVVGPTSKLGSEKMWAYSERPGTGQGPESASCPWTIYCYVANGWVTQQNVTVVDLEQRAREIEAAAYRERREKEAMTAKKLAAPHTEQQDAKSKKDPHRHPAGSSAPSPQPRPELCSPGVHLVVLPTPLTLQLLR